MEDIMKWYTRWTLKEGILFMLDGGWTVLYAIPLPPVQLTSPQPHFNYGSSTNVFDTQGNIIGFAAQPLPPPEPMIEVCFIKKSWEKEPCPRCSYPYPDPERIDREA